jgi:predicted amidophosphoribosyltransferase
VSELLILQVFPSACDVTGDGARTAIVLVPIPHSDCVVGTPASKSRLLAEEIQKHVPCEVWDGLRWAEPNVPSHKNGPRFADQLFPNLRITLRLPPGNYVLVDDVKTSGGHFQAAAAILHGHGIKVDLVVAAGQTVQGDVDKYFGWVEGVVEDYIP